jgi:hypothetical protein
MRKKLIITNIDDKDQQEIPIVSLVAMLRITQYHTLWIRSKVKERNVVALIHSSSTHKFIDAKPVLSVGLKVYQPVAKFPSSSGQ